MKRKKRTCEQRVLERVFRDTALGYQVAAEMASLGIMVVPVEPEDGEICHLAGEPCEIVVSREVSSGLHGSRVIETRAEFVEYENTNGLSEALVERAKKRIRSLVRRFQLREVRGLEKRLGVKAEVVEEGAEAESEVHHGE